MSFLVVAPNGEVVEIGTGIVQGFTTYNFPPLSTDANTLLRYFDGVSTEPLGSIPKIITFSREELRLLSKLRPWKFLTWAIEQDYRRLIAKINKQQFSIFLSTRMKNAWADPNSVYNLPEFRAKMSAIFTAQWQNPAQRKILTQGLRDSWTPKRRLAFSEYMRHRWTNPDYGKKINKKRRETFAWKRIDQVMAQVMDMLFGNIVDEDAEMFPCPHCNRVFPNKMGVGVHIGHAHAKLEDLDELELQSYQSMIWSYHTNGYTGLTRAQKRSLKHSGLIEHKPGHKNQISLSKLGIDVLSTINDTNTPLLRL